jgi:hypothetical protein
MCWVGSFTGERIAKFQYRSHDGISDASRATKNRPVLPGGFVIWKR